MSSDAPAAREQASKHGCQPLAASQDSHPAARCHDAMPRTARKGTGERSFAAAVTQQPSRAIQVELVEWPLAELFVLLIHDVGLHVARLLLVLRTGEAPGERGVGEAKGERRGLLRILTNFPCVHRVPDTKRRRSGAACSEET